MLRMIPRGIIRPARRWPLIATSVVALLSSTYLLKDSVANESRRKFVSIQSPAQISAVLKEHEEAVVLERRNGVARYDFSQLASNSPCEDEHDERIVGVPLVTPQGMEYSTDWLFWAIYDGHGGWTTSAALRDSLVNYVLKELETVYKPVISGSKRRVQPEPEEVDNALAKGFLELDNEIVNRSVDRLLTNLNKGVAAKTISPALSGSCALLAFYDTASRLLRVAVTGDSRAVLGTRQPNGIWKAKALSSDQTGSNRDEVRRVREEHPGEDASSIRRGRLLGIYEPTRAFGDGITKWSKDVQKALARHFFSRPVPPELKTPPYMTAKPEITTTAIDPNVPSFLVLASDGLYELLTNEQVVSLVVEWYNAQKPPSLSTILEDKNFKPSWLSRLRGKTEPDTVKVEDVTDLGEQNKNAIRSGSVPVQMTVQDSNAATHLIRNSLGGANQEQVSMLLSIPSPMSRRYRDDLTVTVVFFGLNDADTGKVRVLRESKL